MLGDRSTATPFPMSPNLDRRIAKPAYCRRVLFLAQSAQRDKRIISTLVNREPGCFCTLTVRGGETGSILDESKLPHWLGFQLLCDPVWVSMARRDWQTYADFLNETSLPECKPLSIPIDKRQKEAAEFRAITTFARLMISYVCFVRIQHLHVVR